MSCKLKMFLLDLIDQELKVVFNNVRLLTNENVENDRECEETSQSEVVACKKIAKLKIQQHAFIIFRDSARIENLDFFQKF